MKMIRKIEQPEAKFDLYFMGYDSPKAVSHGNHFSDREGLIELTHNYGTEILALAWIIFKLHVKESRMQGTSSRRN
jgi:hypothetical protein